MFYGWKLLGAICSVYFLTIGTVFLGFSVVLPGMIESLGWTRTEISAGLSIATVALGLGGPIVAILIRRIGVRATMTLGGIITASGAVITYFTSSLLQFYIGAGVLLGLGVSMQAIIPGTQLITNWFARRRALCVGMFMASGGLGAFVSAPAFAAVMVSTGSWRVIWLLMAAAALLASLIAFLVVRDRPEDMGEHKDGIAPTAADSGAHVEREPAVPTRVYQTSVSWPMRRAMGTPSFWTIVIGATTAVFGISMVNSQLVLHLKDIGISPMLAATALGMNGLLNTVGRLFSGAMGDRFEPHYLMAAGITFEALGIAALNIATTPTHVYLAVGSFGLGFGLAAVTSPALIANFFGVENYAALFAVRGITVTSIGALGPILSGLTADTFGSYALAFYGYSAVAFVAVYFVLILKPPRESGALTV